MNGKVFFSDDVQFKYVHMSVNKGNNNLTFYRRFFILLYKYEILILFLYFKKRPSFVYE